MNDSFSVDSAEKHQHHLCKQTEASQLETSWVQMLQNSVCELVSSAAKPLIEQEGNCSHSPLGLELLHNLQKVVIDVLVVGKAVLDLS